MITSYRETNRDILEIEKRRAGSIGSIYFDLNIKQTVDICIDIVNCGFIFVAENNLSSLFI